MKHHDDAVLAGGKYLLTKEWDDGVQDVPQNGEVLESEAPVTRRYLALQIMTTTDVDWSTINTATGGIDKTRENYARSKLRDMWYNGYSNMYPAGTQWRIVNVYF